jgi:hypothetical protein
MLLVPGEDSISDNWVVISMILSRRRKYGTCDLSRRMLVVGKLAINKRFVRGVPERLIVKLRWGIIVVVCVGVWE